MRRSWIVVLSVSLAVVFLTGSAQGQSTESKDTKQVTSTGKVVDEQGQPITGAKVKLYRVAVEPGSLSYNMELAQERTTKADGIFTVRIEASGDRLSDQAIILAEKEGLALGWANWRRGENADVEIALGPPEVLAGTVVDEAGAPIGDAEVGIPFMLVQSGGRPQYLVGDMSMEFLSAKTDPQGRFSFSRIPTAASAEFLVKKPGRATINTFNPENYQGQAFQFPAGQTDIKIIQPVEAKIEGVVADKASGKPVPGVRIMALRGRNQPSFGLEPTVSREDGTFAIGGLAPGQHLLQMVPSMGEPADWITDPVEVLTEAGKTKSGVRVELSKGGVLEVLVTDSVSKQPVQNATVSIQPAGGGTGSGNRTDEAGIARIRLMPGEYRIAYLYKQGYSRQRLQGDTITVEDGKTVRIEQELTSLPKITGVVCDEQGRPAKGVKLKICPRSGQEGLSDAEGKFEAGWDPGSWSSSQPPAMILLARQLERNLAAAVEIDEDTREVEVTLKPGVVFVGKVVDPDGKGLANAQLGIMLRGPRWGSSIGRNMATDAEGNYEVKAIAPEYKYSVEARADGYGRSRTEVDTGEAVNNQLAVETLTLPLANLSVSGVVVDANDEPVAGADVSCSGDDQPYGRAKTNTEGRFTLEKVCAGRMRISANKYGTPPSYGSVETEGGAADVTVVISQRSSSTRYEPKRPPSLVGKPLPDLKALGVDLSPAETEGKRLLVCFWDMQQRPSRHCLTQLAEQAEMLKDKGVVVVAVQASKVDQNTLDEWVKKYNVPFSVGMIQGDEDKTRFTWGVRSLPWLILTDNNHVVVSQGFSLGDLDNQLGQGGS